ncbi:MAG: hypothetical protein NTW52_17190 [Planctomycetota bacterium]|nr:hypothetical protein [Planctomycetota bacterium]
MTIQESMGTELQKRMQDIRSKRTHRIAEFHHEAERLVSWREYVKSAPIAALIATTVIGFIATRLILRSPASSQTPQNSHPIVDNKPAEVVRQPTGYFSNNALHLLTNVALTAGKMYLMRQLNAHSKSLKT